ncbi:hypothetical protein TNCV_2085231 [Trichonephila clavipes]|uniref:Uncharacterized protein n=1 Tax=Trichonephila clavipes TaxID=2585209 RepID=A0A8X6V665_TRICX|nr:hypothetical protein TNCV_2085231 [Trichonephila clavipes]
MPGNKEEILEDEYKRMRNNQSNTVQFKIVPRESPKEKPKESLMAAAIGALYFALTLFLFTVAVSGACISLARLRNKYWFPEYQSDSELGRFRNAAISTDAVPCAAIGRRKRTTVQKLEIEIKMAPYRLRKSAPIEYLTDEEEMITYDVKEDEFEPNPADKYVLTEHRQNNPDKYLHSLTPTRFRKIVNYTMLKMEANNDKIRYILQINKGENASQMTEIVNGVYGPDILIANYVQFWLRWFRSGQTLVKSIKSQKWSKLIIMLLVVDILGTKTRQQNSSF